jgi:hypothetical protein
MVPYHHSMAYPDVTVGGEGLQMWRVAEILNKQLTQPSSMVLYLGV